jgi:TRAP-type C4-dicarboxylate transport system substrate-binding protein
VIAANPLQIGGDDSPQQVLAKTAVARRWLDAPPWATTQAERRLRVSAHISGSSPAVVDVFEPAFQRLAAMTGGAIVAQGHWGGSLHKEREGIEALRSGLTHLCPVYSAWDATLFPAAQALSLPFLFCSAEAATHVSELLYRRYFSRDFERQGVLMGRMVATSEYNLFSRAPIASLADLQGRRVACSDGLESRLFAALGAEPVGCSTPEAAKRFAQGDVLAVSISDSAAHTTGLWRDARYRTSANLVRVNLEYGLSPLFLDQLPAPLRPILNAWLRGLAQAGAQLFYGLAGAKARVAFLEGGMKFISLEAAEQQRWRDRVAPVGEVLLAELIAAGYPAQQMLADVRREADAAARLSADELMAAALEHPLTDLLPEGVA